MFESIVDIKSLINETLVFINVLKVGWEL